MSNSIGYQFTHLLINGINPVRQRQIPLHSTASPPTTTTNTYSSNLTCQESYRLLRVLCEKAVAGSSAAKVFPQSRTFYCLHPYLENEPLISTHRDGWLWLIWYQPHTEHFQPTFITWCKGKSQFLLILSFLKLFGLMKNIKVFSSNVQEMDKRWKYKKIYLPLVTDLLLLSWHPVLTSRVWLTV